VDAVHRQRLRRRGRGGAPPLPPHRCAGHRQCRQQQRHACTAEIGIGHYQHQDECKHPKAGHLPHPRDGLAQCRFIGRFHAPFPYLHGRFCDLLHGPAERGVGIRRIALTGQGRWQFVVGVGACLLQGAGTAVHHGEAVEPHHNGLFGRQYHLGIVVVVVQERRRVVGQQHLHVAQRVVQGLGAVDLEAMAAEASTQRPYLRRPAQSAGHAQRLQRQCFVGRQGAQHGCLAQLRQRTVIVAATRLVGQEAEKGHAQQHQFQNDPERHRVAPACVRLGRDGSGRKRVRSAHDIMSFMAPSIGAAFGGR
jgi:hypothetical protein